MTACPNVPAEVQLTGVDPLGGMNPWRLRIIDMPEQDTSGAGARTKSTLEDDHLTSTQEPSTSPGVVLPNAESGARIKGAWKTTGTAYLT